MVDANQEPLAAAKKEGNVWMVKCLCEQGANVRVLCLYGADVNLSDKSLCTPLAIACSHGDIKILHELFRNGANVNQLDCTGRSPLHRACQAARIHIVEMLLKNPKVDINHRDMNGENALHQSIDRMTEFQGGHVVVRYLNVIRVLVHGGCSVPYIPLCKSRRTGGLWVRLIDWHSKHDTLPAMLCTCIHLLLSAGYSIQEFDCEHHPCSAAILESAFVPEHVKRCKDMASLKRLCKLALRTFICKPLNTHVPKSGLPLSLQDYILITHWL